MRPASEVLHPALYAALTKRGRPKAARKKAQLTLRVDPAVIDADRATGPGRHTRMSEALASGVRRLAKAPA
ncbi:hypothetical protein MOX02_30310 [Methylobacterium oxalidis]|uniref:Antitoxin n=2 Tax=Methylobacterium oxalidis TaxID=944322 RepID=A0A512J4Z2_9HYPH|nr:hypothetical protein MOX02_30310 [Methylobacterium oxalidis]GJE32384.1 hypothetical protein LDDCCGHA_2570 [Methylobacterium oxalidis]GLS63731.1 hypothetical protein GCM10007888_21120 [Methylobacterium oxalidis]